MLWPHQGTYAEVREWSGWNTICAILPFLVQCGNWANQAQDPSQPPQPMCLLGILRLWFLGPLQMEDNCRTNARRTCGKSDTLLTDWTHMGELEGVSSCEPVRRWGASPMLGTSDSDMLANSPSEVSASKGGGPEGDDKTADRACPSPFNDGSPSL